MKSFQAVLALAIVALVSASADNYCYKNTDNECTGKLPSSGLYECNALFSGYSTHAEAIQEYANKQLEKSYEYLLLATNFGSYQKSRPGFEKQFLALSNKAWDNTINLIKHMTKRGGVHNFDKVPTKSHNNFVFEQNEMNAMAFALDSEKVLSYEAHQLHKHYSHAYSTKANHNHFVSDPEMAHYLEENFLSYQVETVRKLSGYTNDLKRLVNNTMPGLNLYLYDEYLHSQ